MISPASCPGGGERIDSPKTFKAEQKRRAKIDESNVEELSNLLGAENANTGQNWGKRDSNGSLKPITVHTWEEKGVQTDVLFCPPFPFFVFAFEYGIASGRQGEQKETHVQGGCHRQSVRRERRWQLASATLYHPTEVSATHAKWPLSVEVSRDVTQAEKGKKKKKDRRGKRQGGIVFTAFWCLLRLQGLACGGLISGSVAAPSCVGSVTPKSGTRRVLLLPGGSGAVAPLPEGLRS